MKDMHAIQAPRKFVLGQLGKMLNQNLRQLWTRPINHHSLLEGLELLFFWFR